jgi:hypothetical protein
MRMMLAKSLALLTGTVILLLAVLFAVLQNQ